MHIWSIKCYIFNIKWSLKSFSSYHTLILFLKGTIINLAILNLRIRFDLSQVFAYDYYWSIFNRNN